MAPAAGQSPPIGRPARQWHWATGTGTGTDTGTDLPPWAEWRAPLSPSLSGPLLSCPLCPHLSGWSGVRQSNTHAPLLAAAPAPVRLHAQALPHSHPLLPLTLGRPLRPVSLPLLSPPLFHSLSSSPQPFLTRPRHSHPSHARSPSLVSRVRMNLPHSWSVSSSLPHPPPLNLLVPRGASSPRPGADFSRFCLRDPTAHSSNQTKPNQTLGPTPTTSPLEIESNRIRPQDNQTHTRRRHALDPLLGL